MRNKRGRLQDPETVLTAIIVAVALLALLLLLVGRSLEAADLANCGAGGFTSADKFARGTSNWDGCVRDQMQDHLDAMSPNATLKARLDAISGGTTGLIIWVASGQTPTWVSSTRFTVPTDLTAKFELNARVRAELIAGNFVYTRVTSSSFAGSTTTVNVQDAVLTSDLSAVSYSALGAGEDSGVWSGQLGDLVVYDKTSGNLVIDYNGGRVRSGTTINEVSSGTLTLTAGSTNYIEVNASTGVVSFNVAGFSTAPSVAMASAATNATTITGIADKRAFISESTKATGEVFFTTAASCPAGSSAYVAAEGRAIVGMPSGGTNEGTVGTALTNLQDKTHTHTYTDVPNHLHSVDPPSTSVTITDGGHTHNVNVKNSTAHSTNFPTGSEGGAADGTPTAALSNTTGITATVDIAAFNSANPTGGVATGTTNTTALSTFLSYLQLRTCKQN